LNAARYKRPIDAYQIDPAYLPLHLPAAFDPASSCQNCTTRAHLLALEAGGRYVTNSAP
jgi:hypothetical protein